MKKYYVCFIIFISITIVISAQPVSHMLTEPGKCYAKCIIIDYDEYEKNYDFREKSYPVFIGEYQESLHFVKEIDISNQNDQAEYVMIVTDTTATSEYIWETFTFEELKLPKEKTEWREVVCREDLTKEFIQKISQKFYDLGYVTSNEIDEMDEELKAALIKFQIENNLPVGQMDFETLNSLGLKK